MALVNVDNFVRAETDLMFSRLLADSGGLSTWRHHRLPASLDHQPVIRLNRDTLYSSTLVDVSGGARIHVPDSGGRYLSVMVLTRDHYVPAIFHDAGEYDLDAETLGTDYAVIGVRILVDPADPDDVAEVNALQDQLVIEAASARAFTTPDYDVETQNRTRTALLELSTGLPDFRGSFGRRGDVDPVRHLIATASAWGGLPETEAHYLNVTPGLPVGEYRMRLADVPADAFWSVSLYNAQGFYEPNPLGVNNINSVTATPDADGAVTISFGVDPHAPSNFLYIMDGWNFLLRLYRPRPEALDGRWTVPPIEAVG